MKDEGGKTLGAIFALILLIVVMLFGPFALIWAVSKFGNSEAVYDFWHWLAGVVVILALRGGASNK